MQKAIVGVKHDGSVSICKAAPEHRGKGSCKHFEHLEINENTAEEYITKRNEEILQRTYHIFGNIKKRKPSRKERRRIIDLNNFWNLEELNKESLEVESQYESPSERSIEEIHSIYNKAKMNNNSEEEAVKKITDFLNSNSETAFEIRNFLGDGSNIEAFAWLIVKKPNGMNKQRWTSSGKVSASRAVLSNLHYDLDDKKYIASVLFFKGRCCYCNRTLDSKNRSSMPTAEHLTPVSAEKPDSIRGSTRYGNMTLCCNLCNTKRQDQNIADWLAQTSTVKKDNKPYSLGRINAFRAYTGYQEYTVEENSLINESIRKVVDFTDSFRNDKETKGFAKGSSDIVKPEIDKIVEKLEEDLVRIRK